MSGVCASPVSIFVIGAALYETGQQHSCALPPHCSITATNDVPPAR